MKQTVRKKYLKQQKRSHFFNPLHIRKKHQLYQTQKKLKLNDNIFLGLYVKVI